MTVQSLTDTDVWLDGYRLEQDLNSVDWDQTSSEIVHTNFDSGGNVERIGGSVTATATIEGFWDTASLASDFVVDNQWASEDVVLAIAPDGADGGPVTFCHALEHQETFGGAIGAAAHLKAALSTSKPAGTIDGTLIFPRTTGVAASGNGTTTLLVNVASGESVYASLHVFGTGTGTIDVTVESDDNSGMTSPTTRLTFAQVSTFGAAELLSAAGPITDTYWRIAYTVAGASPSFSFAVCLGIQ